MSRRVLIVGLVGLFAFASRAWADEKEQKPEEVQAKAESDSGAVVKFDKGFRLQTKDGRHEMRIAGSAHLDVRTYYGASTAPHSFDIRRARIDVMGRMFKDLLDLRIQAALEDNPYIRNAYIDIKCAPFLHLMVGQMKVPFSTEWLTFDNNVNFMERNTGTPFYAFFDRGGMLWGELLKGTVTYNFGVYTGAGVDLDATKGDIDKSKDIVWRLFLQPFKTVKVKAINGLYLVGQGTWGYQSTPTKRFEVSGLSAPDYESLVWRWRTEQVLADNGRERDVISAEVGQRTRFGAELIYLYGPFTLYGEWAMVQYKDIDIYHNYFVGSNRKKHDLVLSRDGTMHAFTIWASYFITGEEKVLNNFGFKQPVPKRQVGEGGFGAFELLARFSGTFTDKALFDKVKVSGFKDVDGKDGIGSTSSVNASVLEGAYRLYEVTGGVSWTMNQFVRLQLNYTYLWDPTDSQNGIVSAGGSDLSDITKKNKLIKSEHFLGLRFIFKI